MASRILAKAGRDGIQIPAAAKDDEPSRWK